MIYAILQLYKSTTAIVQDPCPSDIKDSTIVVDICKSSSATKETIYGSYMVDSVVLRIMIQKDNCVCRVTIDNQTQPVYLRFGRYDGSSTPEVGECGLAVDINHIPDMSTGNAIAPIECLSNVENRTIPLLPNSTLQFKTRIINGTFNRGYCMRIYRGCDNTVYIVVTACSSTVAMVLLVVLAITCIRKKSSKHININNLKMYHINQEHCCIYSTDSIDMSYDAIDDDTSQSSNNVAWRI